MGKGVRKVVRVIDIQKIRSLSTSALKWLSGKIAIAGWRLRGLMSREARLHDQWLANHAVMTPVLSRRRGARGFSYLLPWARLLLISCGYLAWRKTPTLIYVHYGQYWQFPTHHLWCCVSLESSRTILIPSVNCIFISH